jgi:hypothetical protein
VWPKPPRLCPNKRGSCRGSPLHFLAIEEVRRGRTAHTGVIVSRRHRLAAAPAGPPAELPATPPAAAAMTMPIRIRC